MSDTKFHTHTESQEKLYSFIFLFSNIWQLEKTEDSELHGSKHYHNSTLLYFAPESNSDLLLSYQNVFIVTHFKIICLLDLCPDFDLDSGDETPTYTRIS
jgi:hypothetical protein